ncbi:unnamed protein product [Prunus armeniaca]
MPNFAKKFQGRLVRKWHCRVGGKFSTKSWENGELPWQKRWTTIEAGKIVLTRKMIQAQMWFGATGGGKKSFNHHECWEVVKYCKRFIIIPTGPAIVLNERPLRDSTTSDSPLDSPMSEDSHIEKGPRPIGRKATKAKKAGNSSNNNSKFLEKIARQNAIRIEMEHKRQDMEVAIQAECAREKEYLRKKDMEKTDRETMAMDTSHMSPETKQYWKLEQRDVMRRRLFQDDGPSNTDWLNDQNH